MKQFFIMMTTSKGESRRITSDTAWIGSDFNDRTSSIIVQKKTVETTTTVKATEKGKYRYKYC